MATSQNGWVVRTSSSGLAPLSWITGRVLPGDVFTIFDFLCQKFNATVEPIRRDQSWGWAYREVRGGSDLSNHASATAIDLNAPSHPLGRRGTFSPDQNRAIQRILNDLDAVVRWGGDYPGRPDEMHFEINASAQRVAVVADRIRKGTGGGGGAAPDNGGGGGSSSPTPTPTPTPEPEEEDMTPEQDARLKAVEAKVDALTKNDIVFFQSGTTTFEASLSAGTYRAFTNSADLKDRKYVLATAGVAYINWAGLVANPNAFGKQV